MGDRNFVGSAIEFQNPRCFAAMMPLPGKTYSINPTPCALIFPSLMFHAVTPDTAKGLRISIAISLFLVSKARKADDVGSA